MSAPGSGQEFRRLGLAISGFPNEKGGFCAPRSRFVCNILFPSGASIAFELEEKEEKGPRDAVGSAAVFVCSSKEQPLVFGFCRPVIAAVFCNLGTSSVDVV